MEPSVLAATAASTDLARAQTAFSLAFHILFAVFGVALPWLLLYVEGKWVRTGDPVWLALARKWSRAFAVLFAVGAVSGTVLSFEFGLLWPAFMARYGGALGLSFTLEGFAFFAEAIFIGLYLYGWNRLSPRAHWLTMVPIAIAGTLSTLFIVTANAWMNVPTRVTELGGEVVSAEPLAPFLSPSTPHQVVHMLLAALMCTGGVVAGVYAAGMLRGRRDAYHRRGFRVGLTAVLVCAPLQLVVGDWAARAVGENQPIKLAAMEGLYHTQAGAPLTLGGIYDEATGEVRYAVEVPRLLSLLQGFDPDHVVTGLEAVPPDERPNAALVHTSFTVMVALGTAIVALSAVTAFVLWRRRRAGTRPLLPYSRPWLFAALATGPASMVAMLAGWEVTEGGRQPWIVYGRMRVDEAVTTTAGMGWAFTGTLLLYLGLATALVLILRRMATGGPGYELGGTGDSVVPGDPAGSTLPAEPGRTAEPGQPVEPGDTAEPGRTAEPSQSGGLRGTARPGGASR